MRKSRLWYAKPADKWTEALPIGNSRLGAMVFGGIDRERFALNEDTLWSGEPRDWNNPGAREVLPEARRLIREGRYAEADAACRKMMGPYTEGYLPLADLELFFEHGGRAWSYERELALDTAIASIRYAAGAGRYTREAFASFPDGVIVILLKAEAPASLCFSIRLSSLLRSGTSVKDDMVVLSGTAPSHVAPSYNNVDRPVVYEEGRGMGFACAVAVRVKDGELLTDGGGIRVRDAAEVVLLVTAATGFNGPHKRPQSNPSLCCEKAAQRLQGLSRIPFDELRSRHVEDYRGLFDRVSLSLDVGGVDEDRHTVGARPAAGDVDEDRPARSAGGTETHPPAAGAEDPSAGGVETPPADEDLPTDLEIVRQGAQSGHLTRLLFDYGRYLLISSSRPGSQPANLQGIWNEEVRPPWSSNFTININTEMNYWPAETCNLAECHEPLLAFVEDLASNGSETAKVNYGCRGWVAHHNTDLWRQSAPVGDWGAGDPVWAFWPMGGAWLSRHLWERYEFGGDLEFLRERAYPVMKAAAEFCLDWLVEDGSGRLVTSPSTSPEHRFRLSGGVFAAVSAASTSDMALIWDLFSNCIEASQALRSDEEFRRTLEKARARLLAPRIGCRGLLEEWSVDFEPAEERHRHFSHLIGVHPGRQFTAEYAPELFAAARRSLEARGDEGTGWSLAWKMNQWARHGDGDHAARLLSILLAPSDAGEQRGERGGVYPNLFDAHPPFQIDGNFGATAAIAEMLLQSHAGSVHVLPALPSAWRSGEFRGLCARGGFEVGARWQEGRLVEATVLSRLGRPLKLRYREARVELPTDKGGALRFNGELVLLSAMRAEAGRRTDGRRV